MLHVNSVVKRFATVTAVDGVSLEVEDSEIVALIGPNGAGKTTILRMLLGLTMPDEGSIEFSLDGYRGPVPPALQIGYLPEERGLYQDVAIARTLVYFGVLRGLSRTAAQNAAEEWLARLSLTDRMHESLKTLSKGNQQKVQFISAILHRPRFAILDEPFSGLDPLNQDLFLELIRDLRAGGTTVLLSAHQMNLVERLADRVIVLTQGRTVLSGTIPSLRRQWQTGQRLVLHVGGIPDLSFMHAYEPRIRVESLSKDRIAVFVPEGDSLSPLLGELTARLDVQEIETSHVTLHDVYVATVTGGASTETDAVGAEVVR